MREKRCNIHTGKKGIEERGVKQLEKEPTVAYNLPLTIDNNSLFQASSQKGC